MKLLFATTNQGKFKETFKILSALNLKLFSLDDFKEMRDMVVDETGATLQENALLKAKTYGDLAGVLTLAEDAGLMVEALNDRPGVHSARYGANPDDRNKRLLAELDGKTNRQARFESVFCLYNPQDQTAIYFTGQAKGEIALSTRGKLGFGYDPLFIPHGYEQTFAELGIKIKNKLSHRHQALEKLKAKLSLN